MIRWSFVEEERVEHKTAETSDDQTIEMCWCGGAEVQSAAHEMARGRYRAEWLIQEGEAGCGMNLEISTNRLSVQRFLASAQAKQAGKKEKRKTHWLLGERLPIRAAEEDRN